MPITHGSNCEIVFINCARRTSRRSTTCPAQSTPCNWNRFFAKSTPKVVILFTDPSPLRYESIRHTFILAHYVTPLKWGWVHSISLDPLRSFTTDCFGDAKAGETVRPFRSPLLRQVHLTQQRFETRVAIEWHKRCVYFDHQ